MTRGFSITIVDSFDDYTYIEIQACNNDFAGAVRVYADLGELTELADKLIAFPKHHSDEKTHEFGSRGVAGGYCGLQFRCFDRAGPIALDVDLEDGNDWFGQRRSSVQMTLWGGGCWNRSFYRKLTRDPT